MTQRYRRVVFTINNPSDEDINSASQTDGWSYLVWSTETGESGTPHVQGYGELAAQTRLSSIQKMLGGRAHIEAARGSHSQNIEYLTKTDPLCFEWGTPRAQGARTDISYAKALAMNGGLRAVTEECDSFQAVRIAEYYLKHHERARDSKPTVVWLHGPTGSGKSRLARDVAGADAYWKDDTKWWDGYDAHETVVIDDFRGSWWSFTYMLRLLDRYPLRVECKGGSRQFLAQTIIITSAHAPEECYRGVGEDIHQLLRRIDIVSHLSRKSGVIVGPRPDNVIADDDIEEVLAEITGSSSPSGSSAR